jgi:hypothetical protein
MTMMNNKNMMDLMLPVNEYNSENIQDPNYLTKTEYLKSVLNEVVGTFYEDIVREVIYYNVNMKIFISFIKNEIHICETDYETQCAIFELYPSWYIEETKKPKRI